jgi:hypothetical protein
MPNLHEIVDEIIAREAAQAMARVEVPRSPDVRAVVDELGPIPECREAVERVAVAVALAGVICGFLFA